MQIIVSSQVVIASVLMIQGLAVMLAAMVLRSKQGWRIILLISVITPSAFPMEVLPS